MVRALLPLLLGAAALSAAGASGKIFPYEYDQHDFPNGLRLISIPTDFPNLVSLYIVVRTGSRNEVEPGRSGFAHLFEHMMFRGTKDFPPDKYEAVLKTKGVDSNAYTSDDHTAYHMTFAREDLDELLALEADRFQNLEYSPAVFKTETLAVLGEYNKNSSEPSRKLYEAIRETAFDKHTYRHTTMGFLRDIQNMPNLYDYSRQFFDRYYRPEYTTIVLAGDVDTGQARALVEKHWGAWKRGTFQPAIPPEPPQTAPRRAKVDWPTPTLPWVTVSFRGPAFSDTSSDMAVLDLISVLGFSESSELYQQLVIAEQKVDVLSPSNPDHVDPYLFGIWARVKQPRDMEEVERRILETLAGFAGKPAPADRLEAVKQHLRYSFALGLESSDAIARTVAHYVAMGGTPETINRVYGLYEGVTPQDIQQVARKYFVEGGRTIVTLAGKSR